MKVVESSFCYGFGMEMYYRVNNLNEFDEMKRFEDLLDDGFDKEDYSFFNKYIFANGISENNLGLYIYEAKAKFKIALVKLYRSEKTNKYDADLEFETSIDKEKFNEWKEKIIQVFESRAIIEGEKISQKKRSDEDWKRYFEYIKAK